MTEENKKKTIRPTITFYCPKSLRSLVDKRAEIESDGNCSIWIRKIIKRELAKKPSDVRV